MNDKTKTHITKLAEATLERLHDIITTDVGNRGMKALIVPGDFLHASRLMARLNVSSNKNKYWSSDQQQHHQQHYSDMDTTEKELSLVVILTGFPCCVQEIPPTETDGPPGAVALTRAALHLGHDVVICTDECNGSVLEAAIDGLVFQPDDCTLHERKQEKQQQQQQQQRPPPPPPSVTLQTFSSTEENVQDRMNALAKRCSLVIACERAGPASDGVCYTMRGINMNAYHCIAPLHRLVQNSTCPFVAIGDGGNELGMGKVLEQVKRHIPMGDTVGCVIPADHLIASSVSNWGAYAFVAGAAIMRAELESEAEDDFRQNVSLWISKCLPSEEDEINLLNKCVAKGCRDGVTGRMEATVDGLSLETSLQCLRELRIVALSL